MAILAMCMPILAGKKEKWQTMMDQVANDPNFAASRTDLFCKKHLLVILLS